VQTGAVILPDTDTCYRAVAGRDSRFDGWFYTAVRTTGIYCRPSCPARTPLRANVEFHPSAAAAQRAGFRACKRCRPDASPGSPQWDVRADVVGRALRLIGDGLVEREGVSGLAARLGYSARQLNRSLQAEVGAGPLALARAQRAQTARILLETSELAISDVAFAAGFASVRQFNDTIHDIFATTPTGLRTSRQPADRREPTASSGPVDRRREPAAPERAPHTLQLRLAYRRPMNLGATLEFLGDRAIEGVESFDGIHYRRTLHLPGGPGLVEVSDGAGVVHCRLRLTDTRDLVAAVSRVRRLLDLDADPVAVDTALGSDPGLAGLVAARPGLRCPGAVDGFELAVRAVVGQQISVAGARTLLGRIVRSYGTRAFADEPWQLFPSAPDVADAPELPLPRARASALRGLARAVASGELVLDPGAHRRDTRAALLALPGIGAWTAQYVQMRALGDPDVLMATDLGVRRAANACCVPLGGDRPDWAPWRSYATHHLWVAHTPSPRRTARVAGPHEGRRSSTLGKVSS
jgi:AraC family transcriptional regulator of adaptative response / DNA-3-methyladenine glycosylase II